MGRSVSEGWTRRIVQQSEEGDLAYSVPRFSPDGERIAYVVVGPKHLIRITNLSGGPAVPLEQDSRDQHSPAWSPDGKSIAYVRYINQKWETAKAAVGGSSPPVHIADGGLAGSTIEWSPAGTWICFTQGEDIFIVPPDGRHRAALSRRVGIHVHARRNAIHVIRRGENRGWEAVSISVPDGQQGKTIPLCLAPEAVVTSARMHPDGTHIDGGRGNRKRDIWFLDGLNRRGLLPLLGFKSVPDVHKVEQLPY